MRLGDLTTLANVKAWLATTNYQSTGVGVDASLQTLISRWSGSLLAYLERSWILPKTYVNDSYDGQGGDRQFLRNWPVLSVQQVVISGQLIPASNAVIGASQNESFGYRVEQDSGDPPGSPQAVELLGIRFWRGKQNVLVSYTAGYQQVETFEVPDVHSPNTFATYTLQQLKGIWAQDVSVAYPSGTLLTPVLVTPTLAGTYQVVQPDTPLMSPAGALATSGIYNFAPADVGQTLTVTYGYIPGALEQIAIELVCERWLYRTRIGELSRSMAQQITVKYDDTGIPKYARPILQRYRSILPL